MELNTAILSLLYTYVTYCRYPLSIEQIYLMITVKGELRQVEEALRDLVREKKIIYDPVTNWYSLPESLFFEERVGRRGITAKKLDSVKLYLSLLQRCPWIHSIILTGSCALGNSNIDDDIDLMIITAPRTMFICRLYALVLAQFLGARRRRGVRSQSGAVCVNILLDSTDLEVPLQKQGVYGAREIVSSKVLFQRADVYAKFIGTNALWISRELLNAEVTIDSDRHIHGHPDENRDPCILSFFNSILGKLQLAYMKSHITNEIITDTQLWFHPRLRQ